MDIGVDKNFSESLREITFGLIYYGRKQRLILLLLISVCDSNELK